MSNVMNNCCWLDISHSSFWTAAGVTTSFTGPVTSWHQHNPRSRKGAAAKLDLQQSRGSNKLMIEEKTSVCHANEGDQWILCTAGSALWTVDQHSYSSDYLLLFLPTRESYTDIAQGTVFNLLPACVVDTSSGCLSKIVQSAFVLVVSAGPF